MKRTLYIFGLGIMTSWVSAATIVNPDQSAMTSAFFQGTDLVRGFAGDNRPTFRVSSDNAFGTGPETIYLDFSSVNLSAVNSAILTVQSVDGGFGANANSDNPFIVSAHGVDLNPFTAIIDDTNPTGTVAWDDFLTNNILGADQAAITSVDGFGAVTFDVTALVQTWETDESALRVVALTGTNDVQVGNGFLHGFVNNTEVPNSTFLTINGVPEPSSLLLVGLGSLGLLRRRRL